MSWPGYDEWKAAQYMKEASKARRAVTDSTSKGAIPDSEQRDIGPDESPA